MSKIIPFFQRNKNKNAKKVLDSNVHLENKINQNKKINKLHFVGGTPPQAEDQYYFQYLLNELPPLEENQLSIEPIELTIKENSVEAQFFLRHSLDQEATVKLVPLVLLDGDRKILGKMTVDFTVLGALPANSATPWTVTFLQEHLNMPIEQIIKEGWTIEFEQKKPHSLDLDTVWEQSLADRDKAQLNEIVRKLTPPRKNELNIMGLNNNFNEDGSFTITILFRSGHESDINLEHVPLEVLDTNQELIAKGSFTLPPLIVKANTSKPWSFIFPKDMVFNSNPDLSSWSVRIISK